MFIWKETYNKLVNKIQRLEYLLKESDSSNCQLRRERDEARNLKAILEALYPLTAVFSYSFGANGKIGVDLPENVVRLVPDYFGGEVMRHEAVKVVVLNKNGEVVKVGWTKKKKADTGYSYVLVREKEVAPKSK